MAVKYDWGLILWMADVFCDDTSPLHNRSNFHPKDQCLHDTRYMKLPSSVRGKLRISHPDDAKLAKVTSLCRF